MWSPINFALIRHPLNWAIVLSMVLIAAMAVDVILRGFAPTPEKDTE